MTAAATSRSAPRTPWGPGSTNSSSSRSRQKPSTTPNGFPSGRTPASIGQPSAPRLSPHHAMASAPPKTGQRSPSPSYFGLVVEHANGSPIDSDSTHFAKANFKSASSSIASKAANSPQPVPYDQNPDFSEFRKQSEAYALNIENLHRFSSSGSVARSSPLATAPVQSDSSGFFSPTIRTEKAPRSWATQADEMEMDDVFDPASIDEPLSPFSSQPPPKDKMASMALHKPSFSKLDSPTQRNNDERHHRLSLPHDKRPQPSSDASPRVDSRSNSVPHLKDNDGPSFVQPSEVSELFKIVPIENILLLDLRVSPQYSTSHIFGALNLCIPTTLLKRPAFNVQRLSDAFTLQEEKDRFSRWSSAECIVVYDANSATVRDATSSINTLKKFIDEGWHGQAYIIKGGFHAFSQQYPDLVEKAEQRKEDGKGKGLSIQANGSTVKVAGGCPMPAQKSAANPFFSNIRQNMDLIGGVGQMPVAVPETVGPRTIQYLPKWLREAVAPENEGKQVSEKFLQIEKDEQKRMQSALTSGVAYGPPHVDKPDSIQVAGIEKGSKNRYKDMLPFDHTRVRLQAVPDDECDYINASHVKAEWGHRRYIATQAPVPATFADFWSVVWEQDVRVIVMLTAETENGQQKSHPYWNADTFGPMKLKALSEKRVALSPPSTLASKVKKAQLGSPLEHPKQARRRGVTNPLGLGPSVQEAQREANPNPASSEIRTVLVRKLALSHSSYPFQSMREITHIQFTQWPDFGAIAAADVLGLVEQCNGASRVHNNLQATNPSLPVPEGGERPIVVHCSAGCGRTGTFCAIDSVVDMLKRQRLAANTRALKDRVGDEMQIDGDDWVFREDVDLVEKVVADFRLQRLSMVQNLSQFVLCYEAVVEWLVKEMPERFSRHQPRRSFQG